jgi:outer membrane protein assembly factor BamB
VRDGDEQRPRPSASTEITTHHHEGDSFLIALDKESGKERWRTPRPKGTSWSTPLVVKAGGEDEIVVGGARTIAYDPDTGRELWSFGPSDRGGDGLMASPVAIDELVLVSTGGRRGGEIRALVALPEGEAGEPTEPLWTLPSTDVPGIPSLLSYEGKLYFLKGNSGLLSALDPSSGTIEYGPERLEGLADVYASPVAWSGRIYVAGRDGTVTVLSALPEIETLSVNRLEDAFDASPALAGDELFLRGRAHLYCIAEG